ncbi:glucosaminidase domain-containing protein [Candidatus Saccharibacteria bacterium]|nr:glucosaminidase domain-containing protein [Candidatus Saccharibacteria bacterium]
MYFKKMFLLLMLSLLLTLDQYAVAQAKPLELTDEQIDFMEEQIDSAIIFGALNDMPWETAMAIAIFESGSGTSYSALHRKNLHGIVKCSGGYQTFNTYSEGWEKFYDNILTTDCYEKQNVLQFRNDPYQFLNAIVRAGYNPDPDEYMAKISPILKAVERYRDKQNWPTSQTYLCIIDMYGGLDEYHPLEDYAGYLKDSSRKRYTIHVSSDEASEPIITVGAETIQKL